jgi:hypothetical protein
MIPKWRENHLPLPYSLKGTVPSVRGHITRTQMHRSLTLLLWKDFILQQNIYSFVRTKMDGIRVHCHSPRTLNIKLQFLMISTLDCHPQGKACEVLSGSIAHAYISMRWYQGIKRGQAISRIPLRCVTPHISCSAPNLNEYMTIWIGKDKSPGRGNVRNKNRWLCYGYKAWPSNELSISAMRTVGLCLTSTR